MAKTHHLVCWFSYFLNCQFITQLEKQYLSKTETVLTLVA